MLKGEYKEKFLKPLASNCFRLLKKREKKRVREREKGMEACKEEGRKSVIQS